MKFQTSGPNAATSMSMAQELRTVGQGLESLGVVDFDLQSEGGGYFALGIAGDSAIPESGRAGAMARIKNTWRRFFAAASADRRLSEMGADVLRVLFTPEGLLRLEAAGMAKRNSGPCGVPSFARLAQALRMLGEYLDGQSASLLKVSKRGGRLLFEYKTANDARAREQWKLAKLYGRRLEPARQRRAESTAGGLRFAAQPVSRETNRRR